MKYQILYSRVSTSQQASNGLSIDNQIDKLKRFAELNDYNNILILTDAGVSAKSIKRPAFLKLIELVKSDLVDKVVINSLSRFSRSIIDTIKTIELLNKHEVSLISLTENLDTSNAIGRFTINILSVLSQLEREQIGERTKAILQYKKSLNEKVGQIPFGFDAKNGKLVHNRTEQNTIKLIKKLRDAGLTFENISSELMKRKRLNKRNNLYWNKVMVYKYYSRVS